MDIIYKTLITMLSILLLLATGLSLTLSIADEIEINHYFSSVTKTLVDSHYNEEVADLLIEEAEQKGYVLTIHMYGATAPGAYKYAEVTLSYHFHLDMFHIDSPRIKRKII